MTGNLIARGQATVTGVEVWGKGGCSSEPSNMPVSIVSGKVRYTWRLARGPETATESVENSLTPDPGLVNAEIKQRSRW